MGQRCHSNLVTHAMGRQSHNAFSLSPWQSHNAFLPHTVGRINLCQPHSALLLNTKGWINPPRKPSYKLELNFLYNKAIPLIFFFFFPVPRDFAPKAEELLLLVKQLQDARTLEPRMDDLVGRISRLQRAKQALSRELQDGKARSEELQAELEELNEEKSNLEEICSQKQEVLRTLQLRCQETEAEAQRQQTLSQERKQSIEELMAKIQEEKLKQRKQRLEFEQQLDELMEKHKSLQECHHGEAGCRDLQHGREQGTFAERRQLFQQENKRATEYLEAASRRHSELQQKFKRLTAELEAQQGSRGDSAIMETDA
ncbi:synaptonemal complex central element protein 1 isoform X3 [Chrysemys picta bellii]|uniref:synaptonemal complex central element protein 1 isoform X3 n=1 Tax=Chrysemys picta bellii TaxID=8478 RepID=UPI0032B20E64